MKEDKNKTLCVFLNFLTEHQIEQYADLVSRIEEVKVASEQASDALKSMEKRLADMALLIRISRHTKRQSPPMTHTARQETKSSIILHESGSKGIKDGGHIRQVP